MRAHLEATYEKALRYCHEVRQFSASPGNFAGGLTTIEEKSMGAFSKSGRGSVIGSPIAPLIKITGREPELQQACKEIGDKAGYVPFDVTQLQEAPTLIPQAQQVAGSTISILVNNAGIHVKKPAIDTTPEEFQSVLTTHICASHALCRAVLPGMIERKHGNCQKRHGWNDPRTHLRGCPSQT